MKTERPLPAQTKEPKSILEMTPFELSEIDAYQNRNRGFNRDEDHEEFETYFELED